MRQKQQDGWTIFFFFVLVLACYLAASHRQEDCEERGGTLIQSQVGWVCSADLDGLEVEP